MSGDAVPALRQPRPIVYPRPEADVRRGRRPAVQEMKRALTIRRGLLGAALVAAPRVAANGTVPNPSSTGSGRRRFATSPATASPAGGWSATGPGSPIRSASRSPRTAPSSSPMAATPIAFARSCRRNRDDAGRRRAWIRGRSARGRTFRHALRPCARPGGTSTSPTPATTPSGGSRPTVGDDPRRRRDAGHRDGPAGRPASTAGRRRRGCGGPRHRRRHLQRSDPRDRAGRHVSTMAGSGPGAWTARRLAQFDTPSGVAVGPDGIMVADTGNGAPAPRRIPTAWSPTSGLIVPEGFARPTGPGVRRTAVYVTDDRGRIVEIDAGRRGADGGGLAAGFRGRRGEEARFRRRRPGGGARTAGRGRRRQRARAPRRRGIPQRSAAAGVAAGGAALRRRPLRPRAAAVAGRADGRAARNGRHDRRSARRKGRRAVPRRHRRPRSRRHAGARGARRVVTRPVATGEFGSLNEWLRIGPLAYVHIRAGRASHDEVVDAVALRADLRRAACCSMRVRRGTRFSPARRRHRTRSTTST